MIEIIEVRDLKEPEEVTPLYEIDLKTWKANAEDTRNLLLILYWINSNSDRKEYLEENWAELAASLKGADPYAYSNLFPTVIDKMKEYDNKQDTGNQLANRFRKVAKS